MNRNEKNLFNYLCNFINDETKEHSYAKTSFEASPEVLGYLFENRMQSAAYGVIMNDESLTEIRAKKEFTAALKKAYDYNIAYNRSFSRCVSYVSEILSGSPVKYAMLKGAVLHGRYPDGYRTSNDIDILVLPEEVTKIGEIFIKNGFLQGTVKNGVFKPATREAIVTSKMMRGETVPYIKEINLPFIKFLEIDINFSLDYKNGDERKIREMLRNSVSVKVGDISVKTLCDEDFFLHLCMHLYKEATTLPWIKMKRDMTLYKYCDIYLLLSNMCKNTIKRIFRRAAFFEAEKICAFAILSSSYFFKINEYAIELAKNALKNDPDFLHQAFSPSGKKYFTYTQKDIAKRFFYKDREEHLKEINYEAAENDR